MAVNYDYYRIFYYVAKCGNLTRAAAALMSNQPNVTRVINLLEHELGCRLFVRSNKGVTLTNEGEQLYQHVSVAFEQIQMGEEELTRSVGLQSGIVTISASEIALHIYLLERLEQFHQEYPNVRLRIYNHTAKQALEALKTGQIDYAIGTTMADIRPPYEQIFLRSFQDILVGGVHDFALTKGTVHLKDLSSHSLICMDRNTATYRFFQQFYLEHGLVLTPEVEVATTDLILPMICKNLGIGFVPEEFAREALAAKQVYRIHLQETIPPRKVSLVYDTRRTLSIAAQALQQRLCESAQPL